MPRWQRAYLAVCVAVTGFAVAYTLCDWSAWPRLTYFPYERVWAFTEGPPGPVPSNYIGTLLWGFGGAAVGGAGTWLVTSQVRREVSERWLHLSGGWALTAFAYSGLYYTWNLWPF